MNYLIEELEDQIIATLEADTNLATVNVRTYAGELSGLFFEDASRLQGLITQLPFIFIEYNGKSVTTKSANFQTIIHKPVFRFYVGAQSLRMTQESARSCYSILRYLFDDINAKFFNYTGAAGLAASNKLGGTAMSLGGYQQQQPLKEVGDSERTLFILPRIAVYVTDYDCQLLA